VPAVEHLYAWVDGLVDEVVYQYAGTRRAL
jgi:hypothetical protein